MRIERGQVSTVLSPGGRSRAGARADTRVEAGRRGAASEPRVRARRLWTRVRRGAFAEVALALVALPLVALALVALAWGGGASLVPVAVAASASDLWVETPLVAPLPDDAPLRVDTLRNIARAFLPAVVVVEHQGPLHECGPSRRVHRHTGRASGLVVHPSGLVVTNEHVVTEAEIVHVVLIDGSKRPATIVGKDPRTDLALLRVEGLDGPLTAAPLGDSDRLEQGDWVVAIGNPFGLTHSVTAGVVSGLERRDIKVSREQAYSRFIQTDAFIHKGSSGGPLIDTRGTVVGINSAIRHEGITLAVPVNMLKTMLPQLARGRVTRSRLGVRIEAMTHERAAQLGLPAPTGAVVGRVEAGGPADLAGLMAQDVILRFDDQPVSGSEELRWLAATAGVGRTVEVQVLRGGKPRQLSVTLTEAAEEAAQAPPPRRSGQPEAAPPPRDSKRPARSGGSGQTLETIGLTVQPEGGSLLITAVEPDSVAARAGARDGDRIGKAQGRRVQTVEALREALAEVSEGAFFSLVVERDGERFYVPIEIEAP